LTIVFKQYTLRIDAVASGYAATADEQIDRTIAVKISGSNP